MFFNKEYEDRILCQTSCSPSAYSPTKKGYNSPGGDRFIPSRKDNHWESRFPNFSDPSENPGTHRLHTNEVGDRNKAVAYKCVLKNELLGMSFESVQKQDDDQEQKNMFEYLPPVKNPSSTCSASPLSPKSQQLLKSPMKLPRKISSTPYKVLDAPGLENDFYLNLVDWSSENYLAVGLEHCVYLWEATTCEVTKLCEFDRSNPISSVSWTEKGNYLAVGTDSGFVQVWDVAVKKCIRRLFGHSFRVGALAWNGEMLCSGSRDKSILLRDMRISSDPVRKFLGHSDEVCGLKWSPDNQYLASGGNDNCVHVWSMNSQSPIQRYHQHIAAVKAIAWSPLHRGLLASGGGTQDRHIRFWNTLTGQLANSVDTGSQVCNLLWSKHSQEFVSTHGYSENKVLVWKYPSLTQIAKLTGHSNRVVYLAMAPNGEDIVTGAGEEGTHDGTLRFWNVFSKTRSHTESKSVLQLFNTIR